MADKPLDTTAIVAAFAARARLDLSPDEQARLSEYVVDAWDMADRLRDVPTPGREGLAAELPLRAAWCNRPAEGVVGAGSPAGGAAAEGPAATARDLPAGALDRGLVATARALASAEFTPLALVRAHLDRIRAYDDVVRSYITVDAEGALATAAALTDELRREGPRSPLHGIPLGAKDSIPATGMPCTYNSPLMRGWLPQRDAEAIRRLRAAGAVLLGKHNLNEFGWSLPAEDDLAPPPRNPWLPQEYSVGSSSGGGAAVAGRLAMAALGTDGGGSVRLPAGQHLLFGLKPGHRRVPPEGVTDGSVSEVSILAREAVDVAAVLAALLVDPDADGARDRLRADSAAAVALVAAPPGPLRVALPEGYLEDVGMEDDVRLAFAATCRAVVELGWELVRLPRPTLGILHDAVRANFVLIAAEHFFDHEGPGRDRSRYGRSAGFYNLPGACLTAADYLHGLRVGDLARAQIDAVLADVDLLLTPTSPVTRTSTARNPATHRRGGNAAYTAPFNIAGHPAVSLPVALSAEGMPIGMQLAGAAGSELRLLQAARALSASFRLPAYPDLDRMRAFA